MTSRIQSCQWGLLHALRVGLSAAFLLISPNAFSQQESDDESVELQPISVTGTRIKRTDVEGSTPVTIIDREMIEASGQATVAELLHSSTYNSFGSFRESSGWANGLSGAAFVNLRGLGPEHTLVLLNGRRLSPFTGFGGDGFNLNIIPMDMVERVEILRDGASAIYGSDAIAGVVNIITRKDMEGAVVTIHLEDPDLPGGEAERYSVAGGISSDRGNVTFAIEHYERDPIFERDHPRLFSAPAFEEISSFGFPSSAQVLDGPLAFLNFVDPRCPPNLGDSAEFPNSYRWDFGGFTAGSDWGFSARCGYNWADHVMFMPRAERNSGYLDGRFDVTDRTQFLTRGLFTQNEGESRYAGAPVTSPYPVYGADNPNNPLWLFIGQTITDPGLGGSYTFSEDDLADVRVFMRTVPNGTRDNFQYYNYASLFAGFEGYNDWFGGSEWSVGFEYARDRSNSIGHNYANKVEIQNAIDRGDLDLFNVQGLDDDTWLTNTVETLVLFNHDIVYQADSDFVTVDGTFSFDLFQMRNGPVPLVVGFEYFDLAFNQLYDPEQNRGIIAGGAGGAIVESVGRDVLTFFAETVIPLHSTLELNLAVRYDDYSDFGDTTNPKVSAAWRPTDNWLVRASWGEGFKAPNMLQLFEPQSEGFPQGFDYVGCENGVSPCRNWEYRALYGGNTDLLPEESESWTAGVVWNATDDLSLELTWYRIEFNNKVGYPGLDSMFERERDGLYNTVVRNPDGSVDYVQLTALNLGEVNTSGIDFTAQYNLVTDRAGLFTFSLEWTRVLEFEQELIVGEGAEDWVDYLGLPEDRATLSLGWTLGDFQASWITHYIGENGERDNLCFPSYSFGPCAGDEILLIQDANWMHDLQVAWNAPWDAQIAVGARNLFDEEPPYTPCCRYPVDFDINTISSGSNLYDLQGRVLYMRYKQNF